eukprot:m.55704 g.55704  ORF g.55704 m.55704 type:complete len:58 (+) comp11142_c0_seq1:1355-1528(+)
MHTRYCNSSSIASAWVQCAHSSSGRNITRTHMHMFIYYLFIFMLLVCYYSLCVNLFV